MPGHVEGGFLAVPGRPHEPQPRLHRRIKVQVLRLSKAEAVTPWRLQGGRIQDGPVQPGLLSRVVERRRGVQDLYA